MKPIITAALLALLTLPVVSGCANVGREFPTDEVSSIKIGTTTMEEIRNRFGAPWRVGVENGQKTWTYGKYRYSLFGDAQTTDLVIRFDGKGVVQTYNYNTTDHQQ